ncbi:MAG TPA: hypothetical protein VIV40_35580 [Kofleriaceae bacterium]
MGALRWWSCVLLVACGPTEVTAPTTSGGGESFESPPYDVTRTRLEQTDDVAIASQLAVACSDLNGTKENSWYRVFSLADMGVDSAFTVYRVNFAVQTAIGDQRVKVSIGTYAGDAGSVELDPAKIDVLGLTTIPVAEGPTQMLQASFPAIEVPQDSKLVVEIKSEGYDDGRFFYLGSTRSAEMSPGYLRAPTCGLANPVMTSAVGYSQSHLIIAVSGAY